MGSLAGGLLGWVALPVLLYALSLGAGLLVERVARVAIPNPLLAPVGFCAGIAAIMVVYKLGGHGWLAIIALAVLAGAGAWPARAQLRERGNPGWAGTAALAVYCVYIAPSLLSGGWTWTGYNFVNDTAVQFVLTEHLMHHGLAVPHDAAATTTGQSLSTYIGSRYPLGTHSYLASLGTVLGGEVAALYQPFIAAMVGLGAMAMTQLLRRAGLAAITAAAVALVAFGADLAYHYALQGNIKEIGILAVFVAACAVARELLADDRAIGWAAVLGIVFAAGLSVYSSGAGPWLAGVAGLTLIVAIVDRRVPVRRMLVRAAVVCGVVGAASGVPALINVAQFTRVAKGTLLSGAGGGSQLGQLQRPLELRQTAGVWLDGNYTLPLHAHSDLVWACAYLVAALLVVALVLVLVRREAAPLLLAGTAVAAVAIVGPRLSPYAEGKIYAIASPILVAVALWALLSLGRRALVACVPVGLAFAVAVAYSDAKAYHWVKLAPRDRMLAMQQVGDRFAGQGPILWNEFEEFAKYFARKARINTATEAVTPAQAQLRQGAFVYGFYYDLDLERLDYVERFPLIVVRRGADISRPPANYRLVFQNRYYQVWRRMPRPLVRDHLSLQQVHSAIATPSCAAVHALARAARPGDHLISAERPETPELDTAGHIAYRSRGWGAYSLPDTVHTITPGRAYDNVAVPPGRYRMWVNGSFGRVLYVRVDGRVVGQVKGINTPGQWLSAGTISLAGAAHRLELDRPSGGLAPGDGAETIVGPLTLEPLGQRPVLLVRSPREWRELCGVAADWIELASR